MAATGNSPRPRIRTFQLVVFLLILAMVTAASADWMPGIGLTHCTYAALAWAAGALAWAVRFLPSVRQADTP